MAIVPHIPLSFLLTVTHFLGTNFFLYPAFCYHHGSYNFHQENTEHSLAKIMLALQANYHGEVTLEYHFACFIFTYYHIATVEVCKVLLFALNLAITTF